MYVNRDIDDRVRQTDDYGILYKEGLDPRGCLTEYIDYSIKYFETMITSLSKTLPVGQEGNDNDIDLNSLKIFSELIDGYKKDLVNLRKSRVKITE